MLRLAISQRWDLPVHEAKALQAELAERVIARTTFDLRRLQSVAGIDVGFQEGLARAAVVVLSLSDLMPLDAAVAEVPVTFPYVPGLLAFREGPAVLAALERLSVWPDLIIFDAQGVAHPRRLGLAAHLGVLLDWPSIGCAKSRLCGAAGEPGSLVGDWVPLCDKDQTIGAVVRTRIRAKPLFVSVGHRVDLPTAIQLVLRCTRSHRLPETTRYAHLAASGAKLQIAPTPPRSSYGT